MPEEMLLYSWEIKFLSEHLDVITQSIASLLNKAGFKKKGDWNDGFFTVTPYLNRGQNYSTLTIDLKATKFIRVAPIRDLIDHTIRRDDNYIISSKFQKGPGYYGTDE